mmetsp:Transcript_36974/g.106716  ORF Transcript_36974/g.106716 Transcript_36974/m.106716 type:complete len:92 (+) Transcript_36974:125-400(+)
MQTLMFDRALRNFHVLVQTIFLITFVGVAYMSLEAMTARPPPEATVAAAPIPEKSVEDICARRTWVVLPIVFVCGGVVNVDGFRSAAALMW